MNTKNIFLLIIALVLFGIFFYLFSFMRLSITLQENQIMTEMNIRNMQTIYDLKKDKLIINEK